MNSIIFEILQFVVIVAIIIVTKYLVPILKTKLQSSEYDYIYEMIYGAVTYAEQTIQGSGKGETKKAEVVTILKNLFSNAKIDISDEQLNVLIESAVYVMNDEKTVSKEVAADE